MHERESRLDGKIESKGCDQNGGLGAYDGLRSDLILSLGQLKTKRDKSRFIGKCGENIHLNRLQMSYCELIRQKRKGFRNSKDEKNTANDNKCPVQKYDLNLAVQGSKALIEALLNEATGSHMLQNIENNTLVQSSMQCKTMGDNVLI